jgi:molybdenum cofactor cytidylyltransferase
MSSKSTVAALVLAAGRGTRFQPSSNPQGSSNKLLADIGGRAVLRRAVEAALASRASRVVVVTGHEWADVETALRDLPVAFFHNDDFSSGLASSLRVGLSHLCAAPGALAILGDMPCLSATLLDSLIETFEKTPGCAAVVPVFQGKRGNPALLSQKLFAPVAALRGDEGARRLLQSSAGVVEIPVHDDGVILDVDTPADLDFLRSRLR